MRDGVRSHSFGEAEYRRGAFDRLNEAHTLLRNQQFGGAIYLGGRSAEGILRALIWKSDIVLRQGKKSLGAGHDLRILLAVIRDLGLLQIGRGDNDFERRVQKVARLWFNNMRFASEKHIETWWRKIGEVHKKRLFKRAATDYLQECAAIFKKCEALWQH
jgi:hypothetical protein